MEFCKLNTSTEILEQLRQHDTCFTRQISDRVHDLEAYSQKLYKYADNYIMCVDNKWVGFFSYYSNDLGKKRAYLTLIVVGEKYRRRNYGNQILQFIFDDCKAKEMTDICLEVDKADDGARRFYEKNGFIIKKAASEYSYYMEREI